MRFSQFRTWLSVLPALMNFKFRIWRLFSTGSASNKGFENHMQAVLRQKRMLQDAKKRQGQHPHDRKKRDVVLLEFMRASMATAAGRASGRTAFHQSFIPPAYPPCTASLSNLRPIAIKDLTLETHHRGSYLILRAITPPNRMTAIIAIAEDEYGDVTILQLCHQEGEDTRPATDVVDKGSILLVKEPFFKITAHEGDYSVRVDHLSDVVTLSNDDPRVPQSWRSRSLKQRRSANSLKLEGDTCVGKGEYWQAINKYSSALAHSKTLKEIGVIKRNRSLAYLKTMQYDAALSDAGFPDFDEEASEKALFRAAEALYNLTRYEECCRLLEKLCKLFPANKGAIAMLVRVQRRYAETSSGKFNFKLLQVEAKQHHPPHLDHATYVGPVEIRLAKGKGRGLFATKPMRIGDLVLCEKAFSHAYVSNAPGSNAYTTLLLNIETNTTFERGQADLMKSITQKLHKNPSMAAAFTDLYHGAYNAVGAVFVDGQPVVDTFLVERIIALNAFSCPDTNLQSHKDIVFNNEVSGFHSCGIWIKASFINHSCFGNVHRSFIGDMMIVRAVKDLDVGTEITFPYDAPDDDYPSNVEQKFKNWGFVCHCALCEDIKSTKSSEITKRKSLLKKLARLLESKVHDPAPKLENLLEALNETYARPLEEVPRPELWVFQLLLTRIYVAHHDAAKRLESARKTLQYLGFTITGLDCTPAALVVKDWGYSADHLVEIFLHAQSALEQLGMRKKSKQAEQYARIAYRVVVGEDASFKQTYPRS